MRFSAHRLVGLHLVLGIAACGRGDELPAPGSPEYAEVVSAFYKGVAAVQVGETGMADASFERVIELVPQEPAAWADRGINALSRREPEQAAEWLERARELAPEHGGIQLVSALVAREQGRLDEAALHLRRAVELDPDNVRALYLLAQIVEQQDRPSSAQEARALIDRILAARPGNLAALGERARLAAKAGDAETLTETLDSIAARADTALPALATQIRDVRATAETGDVRGAATEITFLQTELRSLPAYADDESILRVSPSGTDALLTSFVTLPSPSAQPSPPDTSLTFSPESLSVGMSAVPWVRAVWLGEELPLAFVAVHADTLWLSTDWGQVETFPFPAGESTDPPSPASVAAFDYDYDFRLDLAVAGSDGIRLLRQDDIASFADVTSEAIPDAVARGEYAGVWAADIEMDGDMDLVIARVDGVPLVLRNLGDGTFESYDAFDGVNRVREFVWADLDSDGDPDAALLDADDRLHVHMNGRHRVPQFRPAVLPDTLGHVEAIAAGDLNKDAALELILIDSEGKLSTLSASARGLGTGNRDLGTPWATSSLGSAPAEPTAQGAASTRLFVADIDNNGDLDLVTSTPSGTRVRLSTASGLHTLAPLALRVTEIADIGSDGRLDLIGVSADGRSRWLANEGTLDYFATTIHPRAAGATGDRRINSFGIGGEIEVRAGLLYQKQLIDKATVHFGLGDHADADVARIIWPNGTVQAEFEVSGTNQFVTTLQRLKGSCPWVFAFDGTEMRFVTDFLWRTALGLRINAQGETAVMHSEDWVRIRGDQLAARDGFYDVSITAELWETHFFDHVALMVVDHPVGTEVFVDERFKLPAPEPALHVTEPLRPIARAADDAGRDVTALVRELDQRYLDTFELGAYQGIAEEHYVEVDLGDDVPSTGPLWLVASGWVYPTDASINVAITQREPTPLHGLRLEVPDGNGGWVTVKRDLGFPSGKTKTILIDLSDAFRSDTDRRVRLSTNMEVYWDRIAWATGPHDARTRTRRLQPETVELRYRGFSATHQAGRRAPELPDYDVVTTTPRWRDLVGRYTRFGDVRELNEAVDDRYVIMNAGDELRFRFPAPPPPSNGWTRDFVLIGDGWIKDGDYNTGYSETVRPLPYHGLTDYGRPPGRLEDDPGYLRHPDDWRVYHTRYVTPQAFHRSLVPRRDGTR